MVTIREIQQALAGNGFSPGAIDGAWGRRTIAAVRAFQRHAGLVADGIAGPLTLAALFADAPDKAAAAPPPAWYGEAVRLMGLSEGPGARDNPVILAWADDLGVHYRQDSIPWCGLFVAHCVGATLPEEPLPANPLAARSWLRFGERCDPALGAVLVFWRDRPGGWKGHVGFYAGEDAGTYHVLGGNQGDRVSLLRFPRGRLLAGGVRQPRCGPRLAGGAVARPATGGYSLTEQ